MCSSCIDILNQIKQKASESYFPIIDDSVAKLLTFIIQDNKPKNILEIGTGFGYSTITMAFEVSKYNGEITSIELLEERTLFVKNYLDKINLNCVKLITGDARIILPKIDSFYDLVFLDAAKAQYLEYLPQIYRLLKSNGWLITDNSNFHGMLSQDFNKLKRRRRPLVKNLKQYLNVLYDLNYWYSLNLNLSDGVIISIKK